MRKTVFIIFILFTSIKLYSQDITNLEKILKEKYPEKQTFVADGIWMYHPEIGNVQKLQSSFLNKLTPEYEYYSVVLVNYLDRHIQEAECVILLNKKSNSIILVPPVWFSGKNTEFFNLFVGYKFKDKSEIESFAKEIEKFILIGSEMHLGKTTYEENKITIRLILRNHSDTWRTIELNFENNKFLSVESNRE
jgi:hypothetical protein